MFVSARFPTPRNVYRDDYRFVVGGTGLEQGGSDDASRQSKQTAQRNDDDRRPRRKHGAEAGAAF